jgi:hypothetical protein
VLYLLSLFLPFIRSISFGVIALEIVSGKSNTNYRPKEEFVYLIDCVRLYSLKFSFILCLMVIGKHLMHASLGLMLIAKHHIVILRF